MISASLLIKYLPQIAFVAINIALALLIAPFLDGVERKIKARLQNRRGPPVLQTMYDLVKLYRRKWVIPRSPILNTITSVLVFSNILIATAFLPLFLNTSLSFAGDIIVFIYLLAASSVFLAIGCISTGNPYASIGSTREISLSLSLKLFFALILAVIVWIKKSFILKDLFPILLPYKLSTIIALALVLVFIYIEGFRLPFDIPEAEPELAGGILIEYSGAQLGLILHSIYLKRFVLTALFINFLIPRPIYPYVLSSVSVPEYLGYAIDAVIFIGILLLMHTIFASIEAFFGRLRLDQALSLVKKLSITIGLVIILAWLGY